jgi:hypothetical protein
MVDGVEKEEVTFSGNKLSVKTNIVEAVFI